MGQSTMCKAHRQPEEYCDVLNETNVPGNEHVKMSQNLSFQCVSHI